MNRAQKINQEINALYQEIAMLNDERKEYILNNSIDLGGGKYAFSELTLIQTYNYRQGDWHPGRICVEGRAQRLNCDYEDFRKLFFEKYLVDITAIIPIKDAPFNQLTQSYD